MLLKTDSGYPKDTGVNKPWQPLGIPSAITPIGQLHQSPPSPIPGDLGRGPSHQSTCSNIETRMDRPKSVVRVIRGVAYTVHVSRLFIGSSSDVYRIRYLRVFDYVSVSECATGPVRESEVYPEQSQMEKITNAPITPIRLLSGDSSPLVVINTAVTRGGEEIHSRGEGGTSPQGPIPLKNTKKGKIQKPTGEFESVNTLSSDSD